MDRIRAAQQTLPVDVEGLIRSFGIEVQNAAALPMDVAGQIERLPDGRYRISASVWDGGSRRRFTLAHELGHYILHRELLGSGTTDSKAYRSIPGSAFYNPNIRPWHETEANRFAANLLMPEPLVRTAFTFRGNDPERLSSDFKVSTQAMAFRLKNLGLAA